MTLGVRGQGAGVRILGVDPGLQRTGWGVIEARGNELKFVAAGTIKSSYGLRVTSYEEKGNLASRLLDIGEGLEEVIARYKPDLSAVEETFINKSGSSSLKLGQARGAILLTLAKAGLEVREYAANLVKKTVVGAGKAEKHQVQMMVQTLLPSCKASGADAYDALAVAICAASHGVGKISS